MGKGGGGSTNTVSTPWEGQQPYLKNVFEGAQTLYDGGQLAPAYYEGNTVAGQSPYTTQAYGIVSGQAGKGDNQYGTMANAFGANNNVMQNAVTGNQGLANLNGFGNSNAGNYGLKYLENYTGSNRLNGNQGYQTALKMAGTDPSNSYSNKFLGQYQGNLGGNTGYNALAGMAGTDLNANAGQQALAQMTNAVNPYSQKLLGQAIDQQTGQLNGNFSQAGRYGSGAHQNAVADAAEKLTSDFYGNAYNQQMQAANSYANNYTANAGQNINAANSAGQLFNANEQNILGARQNAAQNILSGYNDRLNAANQASQTFMADQQNRLNSAQQAAQAYNTGMGNNIAAMNDAAGVYNNALQTQNQAAQNAMSLYNNRYQDAQWLSDIGANQENYNQAQIDAAIDRYNYDAQRPLTALSNYNQLIQGTYGGTTTSTGKSGYSGSALGSAIGGATAAAGLAGALGGQDGLLSYFG